MAAWILGGWMAVFGACLSAAEFDIVNPAPAAGPASELHIGRLVFRHHEQSNWGPGRPWWRIDWPEAEQHFIGGLNRYTSIQVASDSAHLSLLNDLLFDYPWLLAQQVGRWQLSLQEARRLGEYLNRGGFLVVDDFHGPLQWQVFSNAMQLVLPGHVITDIRPDEQLMNVLYDLDQNTQIPGRRHIVSNSTDSDPVIAMPHSPPRWRGIHDGEGRLMVAINFNMDMGDSWEHADDPMYPLPMTSLGYQFGINYVVYAMTH